MPRRRARPRRAAYTYPNDFAQSLERIKEASGLTWAELARQLGTSTLNVWRWRRGVRPNAHHLLALQDLARPYGPRPPVAHGKGPAPLPATSSPGVAVMKSLAGGYPRCPAPRHSPPRPFSDAPDRQLPCRAHHTGRANTMDHTGTRTTRGLRAQSPGDDPPGGDDAMALEVRWQTDPRTRAWSDLWRRLLDGLLIARDGERPAEDDELAT